MNNRADEIAAQLWCLPQHSHKEMDVEFAQSIGAALRTYAKECVRAAVKEQAEEIQHIRADYSHCHCPVGTAVLDGVCQRCSRVIAGCD